MGNTLVILHHSEMVEKSQLVGRVRAREHMHSQFPTQFSDHSATVSPYR